MQLIFIPGMQCTAQIFDDVTAALAGLFPQISMSTYTATECSVEEATSALAELITEPALLVGHSLGGTLAMATSRLYPEKVAGMALICSNPRPPRNEQREQWAEMKKQASEDQLDLIAKDLVPKLLKGQRWGTTLAAAASKETCHQMIKDVGCQGLVAQLSVQSQRIDERPGLSKFPGPVLAIAAEEDCLIPPAIVQEISSSAKKGEFSTVAEASHMLPLTEPTTLVTILTQWISTNFSPQLTELSSNSN